MPKRVSRRVRMYKEDYLALHIYLNIDTEGRRYYDTVIYRKIKKNGSFEWVRGANLKPKDLPVLRELLKNAEEFIVAKTT